MTERIFVDEPTKLVFETAEAVSNLSIQLGPENLYDRFQRISFEGLDALAERQVLTAVLVAGTVVFTGDRETVLVPDRTVRILNTLSIPYKEITNG